MRFSDDGLSTACRWAACTRCFGNAGSAGALTGKDCVCDCHQREVDAL